MATHSTHIQVIIIIIILRMRSACAEALQTYIYNLYIYIYTHREILVRNHEPCAKALGNYYSAYDHELSRRVHVDAYTYLHHIIMLPGLYILCTIRRSIVG